jgi:hypothetical protein
MIFCVCALIDLILNVQIGQVAMVASAMKKLQWQEVQWKNV